MHRYQVWQTAWHQVFAERCILFGRSQYVQRDAVPPLMSPTTSSGCAPGQPMHWIDMTCNDTDSVASEISVACICATCRMLYCSRQCAHLPQLCTVCAESGGQQGGILTIDKMIVHECAPISLAVYCMCRVWRRARWRQRRVKGSRWRQTLTWPWQPL